MNRVFVIGLSGASIFLEVDHFHKPEETLHAKSLHIESGGKGYNQAVSLKTLGTDVTYLSCIGNDSNGKLCEDFLSERNINSIMVKKNAPTALATILVNENGENQVTVYEGATCELTKDDIRTYGHFIKENDILLLQLEIPEEANLEAIKIAKENNVKVVMNPAPVINYSLDLLKQSDIITPNSSEAKTILGIDSLDDLDKVNERINELGLHKVIITCGANGVIYLDGKSSLKFDSIKVNPVDTTGAGDIFNAALVYYLSNNYDILDSVKKANIIAGISTTKKGVMNATPRQDEIKKY